MSECIYTQEQFDKILKERNELANENFKLKQEFDIFTIKNAFKYQNVMEKSKMEFAVEYAIEQLEKVKEWIHEHRVIPFFEERYIVYVKSLNNEIDNQIEELKKENGNG